MTCFGGWWVQCNTGDHSKTYVDSNDTAGANVHTVQQNDNNNNNDDNDMFSAVIGDIQQLQLKDLMSGESIDDNDIHTLFEQQTHTQTHTQTRQQQQTPQQQQQRLVNDDDIPFEVQQDMNDYMSEIHRMG